MRFWGGFWLACVGVWLHCAPAQAARVVYAVTIGNNQPPSSESDLQPLRYADDDAIRYYELFSRASDNVSLLTVLDPNSQRRHAALGRAMGAPTLHNLELALARYASAMQADRARGDEPVLLLTYSGHGSTDEQGRYFLSFLDGALTQDRLYDEILASLPNVEVHLIVDACNAGGVVGMRGGFDHEADAEVVALSESDQASVVRSQSLARFPFVGALVASSIGQEAHEWSRIEAGVFTHEVISALLGGADVNGDLLIEYSEVQAFVAAANRSVSDPRAVPQLLAHPPAANPHAVLMDLRGLRDTLLLTGTGEGFGRFTVRMADGRRMADAHVTGAQRVAMALPRSSSIYLEKDGLEAELPRQPVVALAELKFRVADGAVRGPIDRTLRGQLFASPYSPDYYSGFVDSRGLAPVDMSAQQALLPATPVLATTVQAMPAAAQVDREGGSTPKWLPIGLLVTSGVALATALVSGALALDAKAEFDDTQVQRDAHELREQYQTQAIVAGVAAAVSVTTGVTAWIVWPKEDANSGPQAGLQLSGRF